MQNVKKLKLFKKLLYTHKKVLLIKNITNYKNAQ